MHWSDDATLDLLENLVARPARVPAILTWRSEDPDVPAGKVEWLRRVQRSPQVTVLVLQPLDRAASAEQLEMICGEVAPAVVDRVHARSRGLPLFTEQLATSDGEDLPPCWRTCSSRVSGSSTRIVGGSREPWGSPDAD